VSRLLSKNTPLLQKGIAAARSGRCEEARGLLKQVIQANSKDEMAWLWLSGLMETNSQKRTCLERVLQINPQNVYARAGLKRLKSTLPPTTESEADILNARLASLSGDATRTAAPPNGTSHAQPSKATSGSATPSAAPSIGPDETLCPACDQPISMTATACPHCYMQFRPLEEFLKPKATPLQPPQPAQPRHRGILGALSSLIS